jgi:hypothetical protein
MKMQALGAVFVGVVAACGSGGKVSLIDASLDAPTTCNPVAQSGCMTGEKCTWIVDIDGSMTTNEIGHIGCVAVGSAPIQDGATCTDATAAMNGGADACIAGDLCISQKCKPICDPQVIGNAATGACAANYACSVYAGVFQSAGPPVAGVCDPTCDPLTQSLNVGTTGIAACGSSDPTKPSGTCVASGGFRSFHCAPSGSMAYPNTDRQPPLADSHGNIYGNGCAPGFIPFYYEDASVSMKTLCSGMCAPLKVDSTIAADPLHKNDNKGDATALGKLPADLAPAAGKSTCGVGVKGSETEEDCRFVWFPLAQGDPTMPAATPYNDTLGICFAYQKFLTVTVPGMALKQPEKSCAQLPVTAAPTDPWGTAKENGCYPLADSKTPVRQSTARTINYRLANGDGPAVRHVFD